MPKYSNKWIVISFIEANENLSIKNAALFLQLNGVHTIFNKTWNRTVVIKISNKGCLTITNYWQTAKKIRKIVLHLSEERICDLLSLMTTVIGFTGLQCAASYGDCTVCVQADHPCRTCLLKIASTFPQWKEGIHKFIYVYI